MLSRYAMARRGHNLTIANSALHLTPTCRSGCSFTPQHAIFFPPPVAGPPLLRPLPPCPPPGRSSGHQVGRLEATHHFSASLLFLCPSLAPRTYVPAIVSQPSDCIVVLASSLFTARTPFLSRASSCTSFVPVKPHVFIRSPLVPRRITKGCILDMHAACRL